MKIQAVTLAILAVITLVGCETYSSQLDRKLEGKSVREKRAILANECGSEIGAGLKKDDMDNVRHSEKMKTICEEMTGKHINLK